MINRNKLYEKAYKILNSSEIFKFDCGKLCNKICCSDVFFEDSTSGMKLLPGEKEFIGKNDSFSYITNTSGEYLVCGGKCKRAIRPFACRIFPYYANISKGCDGNLRIKLVPDPSAKRICPLLSNKFNIRKNVYHDRAIRQAIRILCKDEQIKKELIAISDFNKELSILQKKLFK